MVCLAGNRESDLSDARDTALCNTCAIEDLECSGPGTLGVNFGSAQQTGTNNRDENDEENEQLISSGPVDYGRLKEQHSRYNQAKMEYRSFHVRGHGIEVDPQCRDQT